MALYMDIHRNVGDIPKEKRDEAHKKDLEGGQATQDRLYASDWGTE